MPCKPKKETNTTDEQSSRRRSARLAGLDKEKPVEAPKIAKKEPAKKKGRKPMNDKMSKGDAELDANAEVENHANEKKEETTKEKEDSKVEETQETDATQEQNIDENDFVKVNKSDVPSPDSKEVKEAIKSQGEDGELLVNFVQVTHDDVPDAKVVPATINGICSNTNLGTDKIDEPQQQADEPKTSSV